MNKKQIEKYLKDSIHYIFHHTQPSKKTRAKKPMKYLTTIPPPKHRYGYTSDQMEQILTKKELKKFYEWMYGQTCALDEKTKQCVYYEHDVERFINLIRKGTPTYWD